MALVKGPFKFQWGTAVLNNVSEISVDFTTDTNDITTLDGVRHSIQTGMGMTVSLTLLENDVASLATVLPQFYKSGTGAGETTLSTGETVAAPGAIDIAAATCDTGTGVTADLDIVACGTNAQVLRLVNASTRVDGIDIADGLRTITVMFVGEPEAGQAVAQLFARDTVPAE